MDYQKFMDGIEEVYAIFGKKVPDTKIVESIYKRIKKLPERFMDYAVKHFEDEENLPRNIGRYLLRELLPEFLNKNPDLKSCEIECCPKCDPSVPGWRKVYEHEKTGWGDMIWKPILVRCACRNAPNPRNEPVYTNSELEDKGYSLTIPFHFEPEDLPEAWRRVIGKEEETRAAHTAIHEESEPDWF